ncbi:uncharacterized protein Tco025E_04952 [Trypanosoma conorhini]|uniref:Uncharacterized protein n=1 Tax=Trypanosoma conorhini TaxID=83891 RepID=A0A422PHY6_9TRYP|nr:uncharacterized protein Tco025E_04952 [Trypanosoma conorhini]RNF17335.1 hypothetical protein Tco025E_04952 [Trypanosoma conorhini]
MSTAVLAARACARTILWQSLRLADFHGAVPHVLLVVDRSPCALQKVLLEGYLRELELVNGAPPDAAGGGPLRVDLDPAAPTPCFSAGLDKDWRVTYGVLPFRAASFLEEVRALQAFLRQCGPPVAAEEEAGGGGRWSEERRKSAFESLAPLLAPYAAAAAASGEAAGDCGAWRGELLHALPAGPPRELLGCILIQRHAFQNELEKYRLRLDLFNMGLRVAEHNHLECMSRTADALAGGKDGGSRERCLEEEEIIHYMQSCSLQPQVAESVGRAIADSIDAWSWKRHSVAADGGEGVTVDVVPPASFSEALANADVLSVYNAGVLRWEGGSGAESTRRSRAEADGSAAALKISGPGAPLRIVCHDGKVLSFEGGLEDCLLNTGYYAAAHTEERNCVRRHRQRFPVSAAAEPTKEEGEGEGYTAPEPGASEAEKRGRLKKKEYLATLKLTGRKTAAGRASSPSDGNDEGVRRGGHDCGACVGSSIGGTFPVGEVISESFDLSKLNGTCSVFAYPSLFKEVTMSDPEPVAMRIEKGVVTDIGPNAPAELVELIGLVRQAEGACYVRELGIGLSPHVGRGRVVSDVSAFERQFGVHISLGQRHPLFVKQPGKRNADGSMAVRVEGPVLKRKAGKYHIDVFLDAARLEMGAFVVDFTKGVCAAPPSAAAAATRA